jgi:putative transposase
MVVKNEENSRQIRGLAIISLGTQIKRINKLHYLVKSQSDESKWYNITKEYGHNKGWHQEGKWTCICPDVLFRHQICKHIYAVLLSKQLRKKTVSAHQQTDVAERVTESPVTSSETKPFCPKCQIDTNIVRDGVRHTKHGTDIQRYTCKSCHFRFVINSGFERARADAKCITAALDLYFKGVSLRKVADHLKQFYNIEITHVSIIKWIRKFSTGVKPFVDQLIPPHLSGVYHVDEMMVHVRREQTEVGHYQWLWNLMDNTTRFWISSMVSQRREATDARALFKDTKNKTKTPQPIIHDGLASYDEAFQKEFFTKESKNKKHTQCVSQK